MAKKTIKTTEEVTTVIEETVKPTEPTEPTVEPTIEAEGVSVLDKNGAYVRVYTKGSHGKNFIKMAEEFAKKIEGSIK